jgi:biotin-(acetyl-CoA carboxylase) ligase
VTARGKLAGVLAELVAGERVVVLLGVGLNAALETSQLPQTDRLPATSLLLEGVAPPPPAALLDGLLARLVPLVESWEEGGFAAVAQRVREVDDLAGRPLQLKLANGHHATGVAAGIADDGALLLREDAGLHRHRSGEVARVL